MHSADPVVPARAVCISGTLFEASLLRPQTLSGLLALLLRFYEPCKGKVTYGGRDSRSIPLNDLRSRCAYVSQDPQLFEGTIRWNLSCEYRSVKLGAFFADK